MDKIIALSDELSDLDLVYCYIPISHYSLAQLGKSNNTFIVAPKRYWSTIYYVGCFGDVVLYENTLSSYMEGSKSITSNFMVVDKAEEDELSKVLQVKVSALDRFQIHNNRLRMLRAWVHDRSVPNKSRMKGVHAVIFPGLENNMLIKLFEYLHLHIFVQPVAPILNGEKRPETRMPYSHFEMQVNHQRLLEIIASAKFCIGLPGPCTYLSIHMNIPTVVVLQESETPKKIPTFWGHVKSAYCPERIFNNELLESIDEINLFYEYLCS